MSAQQQQQQQQQHYVAAAAASSEGIFRYERVLQLYDLVTRLVDQVFETLREAANDRARKIDPSRAAHYFTLGLGSIENWGYDIQEHEARDALRKFPQLQALLEYTVVTYVKELYQDTPEVRVQIRLPPLSAWLFAVYRRLAASIEMRRMTWWRVDSLHRRRMIMDAMRFGLADVLENHISEDYNVAVAVAAPMVLDSAPVPSLPQQPAPASQHNDDDTDNDNDNGGEPRQPSRRDSRRSDTRDDDFGAEIDERDCRRRSSSTRDSSGHGHNNDRRKSSGISVTKRDDSGSGSGSDDDDRRRSSRRR